MSPPHHGDDLQYYEECPVKICLQKDEKTLMSLHDGKLQEREKKMQKRVEMGRLCMEKREYDMVMVLFEWNLIHVVW